MNRLSSFFIALLFSCLLTVVSCFSSSAQQTSVDKTTLSLPGSDVMITAPAIPVQEAANVVIDSSTYHKAVQIGSQESAMQEVELSAPAVHADDHAPGGIPKVSTGEEDSGKEIIYKSDRAQKVIPKKYF